MADADTTYFAPSALLPEGWRNDVRIAVTATGDIAAIAPDATASGCTRLAGPALPGMPNVHSHAFQRAMAGLAERGGGAEDFWSWRATMYRFVERLTPEQVQAIAAQVYVDMLKAGYTAVGEFHYLHNQPDGSPYADPAEMSRRIIAAARQAGIGLTHLPVLYAQGSFGRPLEGAQRRFAGDPSRLLDLIARLQRDHNGDQQIRVAAAAHSLRAVPPDMLTALVTGLEGDTPIHIHVAEQAQEVAECRQTLDAPPLAWLLANAPVDERWCLIHATHATDEELADAAARGVIVGLCPTTEANLGDGVFRLRAWREAGGRLAIGSDSHVSLDPAEELRWLEYGQRLMAQRRAVAATRDKPSVGRALFDAATAGGRQALGRPIGRLATGARADLIVLDPEHPALLERSGDGLLDAWIFVAGAAAVRDVIVSGHRLVRDRHHVQEDTVRVAYRRSLQSLLSAS